MALILDDLLLMPVKGLWKIVEKVKDMADQELHNRKSLHKKLLELQLNYEMDEIPEEVYLRTRTVILERIKTLEESE